LRTSFYYLKKLIHNKVETEKKILFGAQSSSGVEQSLFSGMVFGDLDVSARKPQPAQTEKLNFIKRTCSMKCLLSHPKLHKYLGRSVGFAVPGVIDGEI